MNTSASAYGSKLKQDARHLTPEALEQVRENHMMESSIYTMPKANDSGHYESGTALLESARFYEHPESQDGLSNISNINLRASQSNKQHPASGNLKLRMPDIRQGLRMSNRTLL